MTATPAALVRLPPAVLAEAPPEHLLHGRAVTAIEGARALAVAPCPVCDARVAVPFLAIEGFAPPVVRCGCGLGRFAVTPDENEVLSLYPAVYYGVPGIKFRGPVEWLVRIVGARHLRFLTRGLRPGARVLDVGCGRGLLLSALADRGFEAHGLEVSPAACRDADPRAQIRIAPRLTEARYDPGHFDEVIFWHVLEHLRDPRETLEEAHRILRPGGRLIIAVPNFASLQAVWAKEAWFHLDPPRHLFHFPLAALRALVVRAGFTPQSEHHFSLRQNPFGWIQSALNRRPDLPRNGLYSLLHRRAPGEPPPFDVATRWRLTLAALPWVPLSLLLTAVETAARCGATVHIVATSRP